jgi:predicted GIY-YIG superfamily endonuclease
VPEATNGKPYDQFKEAKNATPIPPNMHYAYILRSISHPDKFYYGSTADLKKRIGVHQIGGNTSTRPFRPWTLVWYGGFPCKQTAEKFENYLKTASGKAFARKRLL